MKRDEEIIIIISVLKDRLKRRLNEDHFPDLTAEDIIETGDMIRKYKEELE